MPRRIWLRGNLIPLENSKKRFWTEKKTNLRSRGLLAGNVWRAPLNREKKAHCSTTNKGHEKRTEIRTSLQGSGAKKLMRGKGGVAMGRTLNYSKKVGRKIEGKSAAANFLSEE